MLTVKANPVTIIIPHPCHIPGDGGDARGRAESVCQESGHWSRVRLVCGGSVVTGGGSGSLASGDSNTNVFYVSGSPGAENTGGDVRDE